MYVCVNELGMIGWIAGMEDQHGRPSDGVHTVYWRIQI